MVKTISIWKTYATVSQILFWKKKYYATKQIETRVYGHDRKNMSGYQEMKMFEIPLF